MSEEVLAKGRFRVDRRRALEKMEKFQLADPLAYTLELVAAAVAAGATRIEVENDSDDFVLRWDGAGPTRDELDALFDHLFGAPPGGRGAMLQHLALGVLGALGQAPKWVHVDRGAADGAPALRLAVTDPAETKAVEHAGDAVGTRVHVRQRLSMANLAEALLSPFSAAAETRLLRAKARWCPVPLLLDGAAIPRPEPAKPLAHSGTLWLVEGPARVDVVRHGVTVASVERTSGGLAVAGWFPGDGVALDASRAQVVEDKAWEAVGKALDAAVDQLLADAAAPLGEAVRAGDAVARARARHAAAWLARRRRPLGAYAELPLLVDVVGRAWSVAELQRFDGRKGTVADPTLVEPGDAGAYFQATESATLDALVPGLPDQTTWLRTRAEGRERRRRAEAERLPPEFPPSIHQRRFADGPLRGAVRFEGGEGTSIRLSLRIGGVVVEEAHLPSPAGPMAAIADHPAFATDDAFKLVRADELRAAAEARVVAEAAAFAADHVARIARGASLAPGAMHVLTAAVRAAGAKARTDLGALLASRPADALLRAPAFTCGDGRRLGVEDLLDGEWILVAALPRDCPAALAARVLVLPEEHVAAWLGWLGKRARDGRTSLAEEIRGATRRAMPKRAARLGIGGPVVPVGGGRSGELGLSGDAPEARIDVLRDGIPVCTLTPSLGLPGLVGVVDDPTFLVNTAHDALTGDAAAKLARELAPSVDALAKAAWDAADAPPAAVLAWIAARGDTLPAWALERPIARTQDGTALSLAALRARGQGRTARLKVLSRPPGDVPGFEDAIVATPALRRALEAAGGRAVRDADEDLANATRTLGNYLARPLAEAPRSLAEHVEEKDGVRCRWILPADPDRAGVLRVEARWKGRVLTSWERGESLGLLGLLEGPDITPNAGLTMLRDPNVLAPWYKHARSRFDDLLRKALAERLDDGGSLPVGEHEAWRAVLARLDSANDRSKAETTLRDRLAALPIFVRLDGTLVSRDDLAAARAAGPVALVPAITEPGPADHDGYLLDEPWTQRALGVLASRIEAGGPALAAWREGEARRKALAPREAVLTGETLARAPLAWPDLHGEIGLVRASEGHPDGLLVTPLVDGRPLDTLRLPFPAPAVAVVAGAVKADRAFRTWEAPDAARAGLVEAAHRLATRLAGEVEAWRAAGRPAGREHPSPDAEPWLARYALGDVAGPGGALPVFPVLGGGYVTARTLEARQAQGGVGVVAPDTRGVFVAGAQPVVAPPWMRELLAARFTLSDLAPIVARHQQRRAPYAPAHAVDVPEGRVAWSADTDAVDIVRDDVTLVTIPASGIVPLVGHVTAPGVEVDPVWRALLPGPATDALRARLREIARVVLERLVTQDGVGPLQRPAVVRALQHVLADVKDEQALRGRAGADPLLGRLLAAPVFADASGGFGGFFDVIARSPVRWVEPGVVGQTLPGRSRVWALQPAERALFQKLRPLVDATDALRAETRGMARRSANLAPPPALPARVEHVPLGAPLAGTLWLSILLDETAQVRVGGAPVQALPAPVPGLAGWVEGPFEVDDAFTTARLGKDAEVTLRGAAAELLQREAATHPERVRARLSDALAARKHDHEALLADPLSPWDAVPLLVDGAGAPVDLPGLVRMRKGGKRLLVGPEGATGTRRGERVVVGGTEVLALLRAWFPGIPVEHVSEAETRRDERKREEEARRSAGLREKRERAFVERATKLWQRWCGARPPEGAIAGAVARWAAGERPGWPAILEADVDGPWAALIAFGAEPDLPEPAEARLARVSGLARALREAR